MMFNKEIKFRVPHNKPFMDGMDIKAVADCVKTGMIAEGPLTEKFERVAAKRLNSSHGIAVSSGTAALHLALISARVTKGDKVAIPTYSCTALLNAVNYVGAVPVPIDNKKSSFCMDIQKIGFHDLKAVIVQHTYGKVITLKKEIPNDVFIIEDCAQALGNPEAGKFGDVSILSFYATKMLTTGNGGFIATNSRKIHDGICNLKRYDMPKNYIVRYNYQFGDLQASLGLSQIDKLDFFIKRRMEIAAKYDEILNRCQLATPANEKNTVYYRYLINVSNPEKYKMLFERKGIATILPMEPYELLHRYLGIDRKNFPNAEEIAATTLSIPCYPALQDSQIEYICKVLKEIFKA